MKSQRCRRWIALGMAAGLLAGTAFAQTEEAPKKERPTQPFMRQKLVYSQALLEGLTLEKYDLVLTNAALLKDMSQTNVFLVLKNPEYMRQIASFQQNVDALRRAAKDENLDTATAAYTRVTRSCVECHKYFRRENRVRDAEKALENPKKK